MIRNITGKVWAMNNDIVRIYDFLCNKQDNRLGISELNKVLYIPVRNIKFALRSLELAGDIAVNKIDGKKIFKIIDNENDKRQNAGNADENAAGAKKKGDLPHAIIKW